MVKRILPVLSAALTVTIGCSDLVGPQLQPNERCGVQSNALAAFGDPGLEASVRRELALGADEPLTCERVTALTSVNAEFSGVTDL
ncbi:MAG: hypothetical protein ACKVIN_04390, partial [Longimicrobiales bacterium]